MSEHAETVPDCEACQEFQRGDETVWFRWKTARIEVRGCERHRAEVFAALRIAQSVGPTGHFPEGKLYPHDEGELATAIFSRNGQVVLQFGKSISWVSLPPHSARSLAAVLIAKADAMENKKS